MDRPEPGGIRYSHLVISSSRFIPGEIRYTGAKLQKLHAAMGELRRHEGILQLLIEEVP